MNNPTNSVRKYPQRPVRKEATTVSKQTSSKEALELLNQFVKEVRKEIRQRDKLLVACSRSEKECNSISLFSETFSLTLDCKGGIAV